MKINSRGKIWSLFLFICIWTFGSDSKIVISEKSILSSPPAQFIRYLKSFSKAILDINKPLRLWVLIYTLLKLRSSGSVPKVRLRSYFRIKIKVISIKIWKLENKMRQFSWIVLIIFVISDKIYIINILLESEYKKDFKS